MTEPATDHAYVGDAPDPVAPLPNPDDAERSRNLLAAQKLASLATLDGEGRPYVSLVQFVADEQGRPLLLISELAEHTRNARADGRASLLVGSNLEPDDDPMAMPRVTLQGTLVLADPPAELQERFLAVHPGAAAYAAFPDFRWWTIEVTRLRFVGGYGRMSWVEPGAFATAVPDALVNEAAGIVQHMNDDHSEACLSYVTHHAGYPAATAARLLGVDRLGMDLLASIGDGVQPLRVNFAEPVYTLEAIRDTVVAMFHEAKAAAGG